jgi:replicative DNA helicase
MMENTYEQSVIALILSHNGYHTDILARITADHFTDPLCRTCFELSATVTKKGLTPDILSISKEAKILGLTISPSDVVGWNAKLSYLTPVSEYVDVLIDQYVNNSVTKIITNYAIHDNGSDGGYEKANAIIKELTELIDTGNVSEDIINMLDLSKEGREAYYKREALAEKGEISGMVTGINALDKFTGGWQNEFIIIAGRPSTGKTALALFHGVKSGKPGVYINLEMQKDQLLQRLVMMESKDQIYSSNLRDGRMTAFEKKIFEQTIAEIEKKKILVYDRSGCGVHEAIRVIRQQHRKGNCDWAIIDYLQLLKMEGFKGANREQEVASISRALKAAQKELGIPFLLLCQLNRNPEARADKKPAVSDIRESGQLEQDADTIGLIYRPAFYGLNKESGEPYTNEIIYLLEKHRQGSVGTVEFKHNKTMSSFFDSDNQPQEYQYKPMAASSFFEVDKDEPEF